MLGRTDESKTANTILQVGLKIRPNETKLYRLKKASKNKETRKRRNRQKSEEKYCKKYTEMEKKKIISK